MNINMFHKSKSTGGFASSELFTGVKVDNQRDCKLGFGDYMNRFTWGKMILQIQ